MTADFFFVPGLNFVIEDDQGPVMFVRVDISSDTATTHIQFNEGERRRTAVALARAFPRVRDILKNLGLTKMLFDSVSPSLIAYCQKYFGFKPLADSPDKYIAIL